MDYLFKIWYKSKDNSQVDQTYQERISSPTAVITDLTISPMLFSKSFPLYYLPTKEMMLKIDHIQQKDSDFRYYDQTLPPLAKTDFLASMIVEELQSSHEIEGVQSTRQEIAASTKKVMTGTASKNTRMRSVIQSYLRLAAGNLGLPDKIEDVRTIYDFITQNEIDPALLPDGRIFIKDGAEVTGSAQGSLLHKGVTPEENIIDHMSHLLSFLNSADTPYLPKLGIAHYYFGYIHPFYDGNGRTNRFITSLYLSKTFSVYTAFSFANGCRIAHKDYLDLFDRTNKFNSYGEMNYAIDTFLEILIQGQNAVLESLQEKQSLLDTASRCIQSDPRLKEDSLAADLLYLLAQAYFFTQTGIERRELEEVVLSPPHRPVPATSVRKKIDWLEKEAYIFREKSRPITYRLNEDFLEKACL